MDKRLLALALGMFALGTDSFVVAGILPEVARHFRVGIGAAGQMTTVYAVTYAVLAPTIATLAAGVARKRLLLGGLLLFVMANLLTAVSPNLGLALLTRMIAGTGAAMFSPTAMGAGAMLAAPERRGAALAVIVAGLTSATALGSPAGAVIGGLGDWRWTMVFVSALGAVAFVGVALFLPPLPLAPAVTLRQRLAPLADRRVALTLLTTLLAMAGIFIPYTYFAVVFDRATGGDPVLVGALLVAWGTAGTVANLQAGRIVDRVGSRRVVAAMLAALIVDLALTPWSGANVLSAAIAIAVWGGCGWGILVPQQHRLVGLAPTIAPIVVGLNTSGTYLGVTLAGGLGAAALTAVGGHALGLLAAALLVAALGASMAAARRVAQAASPALPVARTV
jgi:MFS transporter, DHA1 family, inner membrane transport protein